MIGFLKRIFGTQKLEDAKKVAEEELAKSQAEAEKAKTEEAIAKMTPKERATAKGEPWVAVLDTHINKDNIRNGFFELDWNEQFILELKRSGYGYDGDPEEEIVDRWFQNVCRHVVMETWEQEEAMRKSGIYVKTTDLGNGRKEVS